MLQPGDYSMAFRNVITTLAWDTLNSQEKHVKKQSRNSCFCLLFWAALWRLGNFSFGSIELLKYASQFMMYESDCTRTKCLQQLFLSFGGSARLCKGNFSGRKSVQLGSQVFFFFFQSYFYVVALTFFAVRLNKIELELHQIDSK